MATNRANVQGVRAMDKHEFVEQPVHSSVKFRCYAKGCGLPPSADVHDTGDPGAVLCPPIPLPEKAAEASDLNIECAFYHSSVGMRCGTPLGKHTTSSLSHEFVHPVPASAPSERGLGISERELREAVLRVIDDGHWMLNSEDESSEESAHRLAFCDALVARLREVRRIAGRTTGER